MTSSAIESSLGTTQDAVKFHVGFTVVVRAVVSNRCIHDLRPYSLLCLRQKVLSFWFEITKFMQRHNLSATTLHTC